MANDSRRIMMRAADIVSMITLVVLIVISLGEIGLIRMLGTHQDVSDRRAALIVANLREGIVSQRLIACIMAIPQDRREAEYKDTNSFCRQMSALPKE